MTLKLSLLYRVEIISWLALHRMAFRLHNAVDGVVDNGEGNAGSWDRDQEARDFEDGPVGSSDHEAAIPLADYVEATQWVGYAVAIPLAGYEAAIQLAVDGVDKR